MGITPWVHEHSIVDGLSINGTLDHTQSNPLMVHHNRVGKITGAHYTDPKHQIHTYV